MWLRVPSGGWDGVQSLQQEVPSWKIPAQCSLRLEVPGWAAVSAEAAVWPAGHQRELAAGVPGGRQAQGGDGECEVQLVREEEGRGVRGI